MSETVHIDFVFSNEIRFTKDFLNNLFNKIMELGCTFTLEVISSAEIIQKTLADISKEDRSFVELKKDNIYFSLSLHENERILSISIERGYFRDWEEKEEVANKNTELLVELIKKLYLKLSPFYVHGGYMSDETAAALYDVDVIQEISSGRLPALLWINIFSPEALRQLGSNKPKVKAGNIEKLEDSGILIILKKNPLD